MIGIILEFLVDLGLIREDYKHHKKITKKEKEDGVKRPFQKYVLQPSSLMVIVFLIITSLSAILFFTYQRSSIFPKNTKKEITEITEWTEKWYEKFGNYPADLNKLIGNNPMRQSWKNDAWDRPYKYIILDNGKGFQIISAGADGQFETEDDIKSE